MPVEQWLRSFDDADFVLTDSFHGCVFSIIFRKQFLAIGNKDRGLERFNSLLNLFSIKDRLISSPLSNYDNITEINYAAIDQKLNGYRLSAMDYLKKSF